MTTARLLLHGRRGRRSASFDADAEVLQTDVMRFMALLGFVLVGIFALVQAIPVTSTDRRPVLEQRAQLERELAELRQHVASRRRELRELSAAQQQAQAAERAVADRAGAARAALQGLQAQTRAVRDALAGRREALAATQRALEARRAALNAIRSRVERERGALRSLERRVAALRSEADAAAAAARPAQGPAEKASAPPAEAAPSGDEGGVPARGFVLKFQSEAAFDRLVARGEVAFFALVGDRAWQAVRRRGATRFTAASPPAEYHEMAPATVPRHYLERFRDTAAAMDAAAVIWGAVLPARTLRAVREAMAGESAAAIVIQADGSVRLEDVRS